MKVKGRFAPSPSGRMHIGNMYAALLSWLSVRAQNGSWILRMEDLDQKRCRHEYATQLLDDLRWLGLDWDEGPSLADGNARDGADNAATSYFQSERTALYQAAYNQLCAQGLIYDCYCRRADLAAARAPHARDGTPTYNGHCRALTAAERVVLAQKRNPAQRVCVSGTVPQASSDDRAHHAVRKSASSFPAVSTFCDEHYGTQNADLARDCGDFIVRRADGTFAYQLAVTVDDAMMGVTEVLRGRDLLLSTHQQLFLYRRLNLTPPRFCHIPLLVTKDGRRLSKRDHDCDMGVLRACYSPEQLIGIIMHLCGCTDHAEPMTAREAVSTFRWERLPLHDITVQL